MNTRKGFITLGIIDLLYLGIFALYIGSPVDLGYYPIGIVQLILLIGCLITLWLFARNFIFTKNIKLVTILLFIGFILTIMTMLSSLFIWFAFLP